MLLYIDVVYIICAILELWFYFWKPTRHKILGLTICPLLLYIMANAYVKLMSEIYMGIIILCTIIFLGIRALFKHKIIFLQNARLKHILHLTVFYILPSFLIVFLIAMTDIGVHATNIAALYTCKALIYLLVGGIFLYIVWLILSIIINIIRKSIYPFKNKQRKDVSMKQGTIFKYHLTPIPFLVIFNILILLV